MGEIINIEFIIKSENKQPEFVGRRIQVVVFCTLRNIKI